MSDGFSQAYAEYLEGTYDSPDRIVLNAYFRRGHIPGGFRNWWRELYGTDENLDDAHLMRLAGRFSRRLRAYGQKEGIPVIDCPSGERKAELAQKYLPQAPTFVGFSWFWWGEPRPQPGMFIKAKMGASKRLSANIRRSVIIIFTLLTPIGVT